jgi:hypothetical protein
MATLSNYPMSLRFILHDPNNPAVYFQAKTGRFGFTLVSGVTQDRTDTKFKINLRLSQKLASALRDRRSRYNGAEIALA